MLVTSQTQLNNFAPLFTYMLASWTLCDSNICYIAFDILSFDIVIFVILGRSSKNKQAKYHSIDSKEGKPSLLSTSSETSSESEVSSDDDSGDPSGEFRMLSLNILNSLAFSG